MKFKRLLILALSVMFAITTAKADEGMWLPSLIGRQVKDMKANGFRLSAEDVYSINKASLKDAVVLFDGGCTGELVSPEGLILTNHHCGYDYIQSHSTLSHDYLTNGFWAMNRTEELPNPGLNVKFLMRMDDVTDKMLRGVEDSMTQQQRKALLDANEKIIKEQVLASVSGNGYKVSVEPLYYGNQYFMFLYRQYSDVRLVAAPPSSIGKFGGDTDNWIWPRHTGDFSVFRIYAGADNQPAEYSKDNAPYKSEKFFDISTKGVKENDFTFVYGFPGSTREYVMSDFVDYTLNHSNPAKIRLRTERLDIIKAAINEDPAVRIMYSAKAVWIANAWKKWQGESLGLARLGTVDKKRDYEARFNEWAVNNPEYAGLTDQMSKLYAKQLPYSLANDYYKESVFTIELPSLAAKVVGAGYENLPSVDELYKDYSAEIDRRLAKEMMREFASNVPEEFMPEFFITSLAEYGSTDAFVDYVFDNSVFTVPERYEAMKKLDKNSIGMALMADPAIIMYNGFFDAYDKKVMSRWNTLNSAISALYPKYMRGQMEFEPQHNFYPDANLTLRVAYGSVGGYKPADGIIHYPFTTLDGIMEKDNPEIYDYNIPQSMRDLYSSKNYGRWGINVGTKHNPVWTVPVAFIATNHTTGGNSGSPVLNGRGELVGINFDRTWLSTMSDLEFDPAMCRNIVVDIRYVLFVIDKIGNAGYLIDEMTLKN